MHRRVLTNRQHDRERRTLPKFACNGDVTIAFLNNVVNAGT